MYIYIIKFKTKWKTIGSNLKLEATYQLISSICSIFITTAAF